MRESLQDTSTEPPLPSLCRGRCGPGAEDLGAAMPGLQLALGGVGSSLPGRPLVSLQWP